MSAVTRENVAAELLSIAEQMDTAAERLCSLGLSDASDSFYGLAVSRSIELQKEGSREAIDALPSLKEAMG